ncbi:hypothetical protein [Synechococcus sp. PCC 7336]|uniref:hypothetical protein n=1 Tax=Synechococcus sp. PCC 7336 TaxID=195250 RepID=UPI000349377C|nr:hypothetical protein [Synechococcus sp. PCC 7336]
MDSSVNILVSVREDCSESEVEEIARQLCSSGMSVVEVMPLVGVVSGRAERSAMKRLAGIPGVVGVEEDQVFTAY